jgi:metal-responsive CopG/Arc/MetJ family transcriptional regulator
MARVTISVDDSILHKLDDEAHKYGISRSECVAKAIESYITGSKHAEETLHNTQIELNNSQIEVMQLKQEISKLDNRIVEKDKIIESGAIEINQIEEKLNHSYADVNQVKQEISKYEMAFKSKDDEINFLRSHISQLTQTLSQQFLLPSKEEIKKKGWWQFWKK